jgi:hypothetical protein
VIPEMFFRRFKLCNPEFPIKWVIGYGAAGGIVLCLLALCF